MLTVEQEKHLVDVDGKHRRLGVELDIPSRSLIKIAVGESEPFSLRYAANFLARFNSMLR